MRRLALALFALIFVLSAQGLPARAAAAGRGSHRLSQTEARQMVVLVARHDRIDLTDTHVELNSMDLSADFIPGYASFIVIRESSTPGPDETLRRYAVNRNTGDVWEMTLCRHYDFPELQRLRASFGGRHATGAADLAAQSRELGCSEKGRPAL